MLFIITFFLLFDNLFKIFFKHNLTVHLTSNNINLILKNFFIFNFFYNYTNITINWIKNKINN